MSRKYEKTAQIMTAAVQEFLAKGLDAASMHNIAEVSGVSKRTLYKYFSTKDELYSALVDEILDRFESMYDFSYDSDHSPQEQIVKIIDAKMEMMLSESFIQINKIVIGELLKGRMPDENQMTRLNKNESVFVEWIERMQSEGKMKRDVEAHTIAEQTHSILKGQIYWPVLLGIECRENLDLENVRKSTVDFFVNTFC